MTVAQVATGSQACTINTEHTLNSPAGGQTYVLDLDLTNLVALDVLEVRLLKKVLTGGSLCLVQMFPIFGPPAGAGFMSIPLPSAFQCSFTIKQTAGTGRTLPWSVLQID